MDVQASQPFWTSGPLLVWISNKHTHDYEDGEERKAGYEMLCEELKAPGSKDHLYHTKPLVYSVAS